MAAPVGGGTALGPQRRRRRIGWTPRLPGLMCTAVEAAAVARGEPHPGLGAGILARPTCTSSTATQCCSSRPRAAPHTHSSAMHLCNWWWTTPTALAAITHMTALLPASRPQKTPLFHHDGIGPLSYMSGGSIRAAPCTGHTSKRDAHSGGLPNQRDRGHRSGRRHASDACRLKQGGARPGAVPLRSVLAMNGRHGGRHLTCLSD